IADLWVIVCIAEPSFICAIEGVACTLCRYWADATEVRASIVQAVSDMLEIVAPGTLKGSGVRILLDHLGATPKESWQLVMGKDVEMLKLASLGVALSNGLENAKAVAPM
ncbi:UNVERIFIED_CONTAM: Endoribonuclease YBEY, chloroplastic, partial [Sesamum radiatum]